ncbi:MAG: phosphonopyruvate decarboxylase [Thiotrichales bacterium]|nr:phosphonopyruvate decarboxylase [Thiotrichales bacterium]
MPQSSITWPDTIYQILRDWEVDQLSYVPDAGHARLIERAIADNDVHAVALTTEEEGVALAAGAHLGNARAALLMQSSGVGNCANMFSLVKSGQFPLLVLVSMRGDFGEANPWQMPMGQAARPILESCGFVCLTVDSTSSVEPTLSAACTMVFKAGQAVAVLLGQRLIGAKAF